MPSRRGARSRSQRIGARCCLRRATVNVGFDVTNRGLFGKPARFTAVDGVSLTLLKQGQTLGVVGESGLR